jgi:hypothetical protein
MSAMVAELYAALRKAGVDEQLARDASSAVLGADARSELATKADLLAVKTDVLAVKADVLAVRAELKADMAEMKVELIKWNVGAMAVLTGIFAAIVRLG